jgi:hypothetical protein
MDNLENLSSQCMPQISQEAYRFECSDDDYSVKEHNISEHPEYKEEENSK